MRRGISFEVPNEYGSVLREVLKPIDLAAFSWRIGDGEEYKVVDNQLDEGLFSGYDTVIEGTELKVLIENEQHYLIFLDLQAYPKGKIAHIHTYEEFLISKCELVLLVVDSCYVTIYLKNQETIELFYNNAIKHGFSEVSYITDENDTRTRLCAW